MPKLLYVTRSLFYPESTGGGEQSSLYLFRSLRQRGWQIEVICGISRSSRYFWKFRRTRWQARLLLQNPPCFVKDEELGYPCWRGITHIDKARQWLDQRLQEYQPDVIFSDNCGASIECQVNLVSHAACQGYSTFFFVRSVDDIKSGKADCNIPDQIYAIANSPFAASIVAPVTPNEVGVVLPFIDLNRYQVKKRNPGYITFINPIPEKGVEVAIEVARRLPEERFLFVKGKWAGYTYTGQEPWMKPIYALPNVEVWENQQDTRQIYAVTDILLVPSQFYETFGRVILEAQVNSIPVVAANIGGIPYTLGQGGILATPHDDPDAYVDALRVLRTDEGFYKQLSTLAFQNSQRPEFDSEYQVNNFISFIESHLNQRAVSKPT
jgi:glycosyltransferase involved in cell wall biosynthesis